MAHKICQKANGQLKMGWRFADGGRCVRAHGLAGSSPKKKRRKKAGKGSKKRRGLHGRGTPCRTLKGKFTSRCR